MMDYRYKETLQLSDVNYVNMNDLQPEEEELFVEDEHFKQEVLYETSGVHIPIEIYEGCKFF